MISAFALFVSWWRLYLPLIISARLYLLLCESLRKIGYGYVFQWYLLYRAVLYELVRYEKAERRIANSYQITATENDFQTTGAVP